MLLVRFLLIIVIFVVVERLFWLLICTNLVCIVFSRLFWVLVKVLLLVLEVV